MEVYTNPIFHKEKKKKIKKVFQGKWKNWKKIEKPEERVRKKERKKEKKSLNNGFLINQSKKKIKKKKKLFSFPRKSKSINLRIALITGKIIKKYVPLSR